MHDEIADSVNAEDVHKIVRVDDIALGLGHLFTALQQPGVAEDLFGKRHAQSHQEDRPVDGVETDDVLADQMKVGGPVLIKERITVAVGIVAQAGDIVAQRIEPHIDDVTGRKIDRDAPGEGGAGDAQVLQTGQQEVVHHLILAGNGLNELGMRIDMLDQAVRIFFHTEEIGVLLSLVDRIAADGTLTLFLDLRRSIKSLTLLAVHTAVVAEINVTLIIELFKDLLDLTLVVGIRRADKTVIRRIHEIPEPLDLSRDLIYKLLGTLTRAGSPGLDLLPVFIRTCHKTHIEAIRPFVSRDAVRKDDLIAVADMGLAGCVGDRCSNVILSFILHNLFPPFPAAGQILSSSGQPAIILFYLKCHKTRYFYTYI